MIFIMKTEELKKEEEILGLKEIEKIEGGACTAACESGCFWTGKEAVRTDLLPK
jgi:hypothetical protein